MLADPLALLWPAGDSGSEDWRVDLWRWAGVGTRPCEDFACRSKEACKVCWFGASASQDRLETSESKKCSFTSVDGDWILLVFPFNHKNVRMAVQNWKGELE